MIPYRGQVMTLANSIIGVGILAMPFCFQKCGVILSILLIVISNYISRISCHYLIKCSSITRRKNFEYLAFHAFGSSGKLMVELCVIGYLVGTCIAYFVVVGDLGPIIIAKIFNFNQTDELRYWVMIVVTIVCVIPLGLLRNVDSLSAVCTASIGFYLCLVVTVMAESKQHLVSGDWTDKVELWKPSGVLQCLPIFSMALSCQMQIFEVFETIPNPSLEKINAAVRTATNICTAVYISVGFFGYVAFCNQQFSGNILVNFAPSLVSDIIKTGFVISVAFSFPLVIFPCRASLYSLLYKRGHSDAANYIPEIRFKSITVAIVLISLMIGLLIPSIELVIGLVGSTIGVAICIMFPASCFIKISKKESNEKMIAQIILIFGFMIMILGTYANLSAIDEKKSGPMIEIEKIITTKLPINIIVESVKKEQDDVVKIDLNPNLLIDDPKILKDEIKLTTKTIKIVDDSNINKEAIQKEENEIAIEEHAKIKEEIVQLEKTKEILQEQVNEINAKFAKQKEETEKLVLEKFEEIAEKVEKIEHEQQEQKEQQKESKENLEETKKIEPAIKQEIVEINPVLKLLTDTAKKNNIDLKKAEYKTIDDLNNSAPLSYKIGEAVNEKIEKQKLNQKIVPLPILITNKNLTKKDEKPPIDVKSLNEEVKKENDNSGIESIRRDLLEVDLNKLELTTSSVHDREKREINENCDKNLNENVVKIEDLVLSVDSELKVFGRDLKSVDDEK